MRWPDECEPVREGPDPSTRLGSGHSAAFLKATKHEKSEAYWNGTEWGPRIKCQVCSSMLY
jgi:hypothetical protein